MIITEQHSWRNIYSYTGEFKKSFLKKIPMYLNICSTFLQCKGLSYGQAGLTTFETEVEIDYEMLKSIEIEKVNDSDCLILGYLYESPYLMSNEMQSSYVALFLDHCDLSEVRENILKIKEKHFASIEQLENAQRLSQQKEERRSSHNKDFSAAYEPEIQEPAFPEENEASDSMSDFSQKVEKLKLMYDAGLLTEEEFASEKQKLISEI